MSALPMMQTDEMMIAEQLLRRIAPESGELVCHDDRVVAFRVRKDGWRLSKLIFSKESLRKLVHDPLQRLKLDWLVRDIAQSAVRRQSYVYPYRLRFER
jgi:hypothetical protein